MKVVTYKGKKWCYAKTQHHGIFGKRQYFVDTEPIIELINGKYYIYPIIDKYKSSVIFDIFVLIIPSIGFVFSCLGKSLILLLLGRVKLIFDKDVYTQTLNGDNIPLLEAIHDIKVMNSRGWCQWYEVRSDYPLTYKELCKAIKRNQDYENTIIEVRNKKVQNRPIDS